MAWLGCKIWLGILFLVLGIIFIFRDYGFWNFKLEPLTAVMIVIGLAFLLCPKKRKK